MKDAVLLIILIIVFVSGYFVMKKFDVFMDNNLKDIEDNPEKSEPSYIVLTQELSDDEILEEIQQLRNDNRNTDIYIYCNKPDAPPSDNLSENK